MRIVKKLATYRGRDGLPKEGKMKPVPFGATTCAVGPSGTPRQEQRELVAHTLGAYQCTMELYYETNFLPGQEDSIFRIVLKKFYLRIFDAVKKITWKFTCKKNGSALLFTPFYCTGTEEDDSGEKRAIARNFSWLKGQLTEDVCKEFIDSLQ